MSFPPIDQQIDQAIQVLKHLKREVQSSQVAENENGEEPTSIANLEKRIVELSLENKRLYSYIESLEDRIDEYIESLKADLKDETVTDLGDKTSVTIGELSAGYNIFKTGNSIFIVYKDNTFALEVPTATTGYPVPKTTTTSFPVDKQYAMLVGEIQVGTTSVSYVAPILTAN